MATRQRPGDLGASDARALTLRAGVELRGARRIAGLSIRAAARRAGMSASQLGRIERGLLQRPSLTAICRAARAVGLDASLRFFPSGVPVRDKGQLPLLARFERLLALPLRMLREVGLPGDREQRAWDGRISADGETASIEAEARVEDVQALERRVAAKQRDDPDAGVVILVLNRTAHNRRVLAEHREALRVRFPLDGAAIARYLRAGRVPPASGIILV